MDYLSLRQPAKDPTARCSEDGLPARIAALLYEALHLLRARARGDHERVRHVDDYKVVHAQAGDEPPRLRDHDAPCNLLRQDCELSRKKSE